MKHPLAAPPETAVVMYFTIMSMIATSVFLWLDFQGADQALTLGWFGSSFKGWELVSFIIFAIACYLHIFKLALENRGYRQSKPNIRFYRPEVTPIYLPGGTGGRTEYCVAQAWFVNSPQRRLEQSAGRDVSATIYFGANQKQHRNGKWAVTADPDNAGCKNLESEIYFPPNGVARKLMLAIKRPNEDECYIFATDSYSDPARRLDKGEHRIRVVLQGYGVDQTEHFILKNPGAGRPFELDHINSSRH